jgi:hypothetical protein
VYRIQSLSEALTAEFGRGYSKRNLELIRKFYFTYKIAKSPISQSLTWTHYLHLMRIQHEAERSFYVFDNANFDFNGQNVRYPISLEKIACMFRSAIDKGFASFAEA